jgi:SAM-dependent methyltransferase
VWTLAGQKVIRKMVMKKPKLLRRLLPAVNFFRSFGLDPLRLVEAVRALPYYLSNRRRYRAQLAAGQGFPLSGGWHFATADRFRPAGDTFGHYFWQDLWAADWLYRHGVRKHVDVASRMDGFVAHLLPFCEVTYVDLRPLPLAWPTLRFEQGSILSLPFGDASVPSLSCLHVLEHIGLGRYGDPVNPQADREAAAELQRVLAPGGWLLFGTPVGRERLCFDAHRVYDPATIEKMFSPLRLVEFNLIPDRADRIVGSASFDDARECEYGCGLFVFTR